MKKRLFNGIIVVVLLVSLVIGMTGCSLIESIGALINPEQEPEKIQLTKENFSDYFSYDMECHAYSEGLLYGSAKFTISFYCLQNVEIENGTFTICLDANYEDYKYEIWTSNSFRSPYSGEKGIVKEVKIPYDGTFEVTIVEDDMCLISWYYDSDYVFTYYNPPYYVPSPPPVSKHVKITILSASGTIVPK